MMRAICQFKILTLFVLTFFVLSSKGQIYQSMPQYGYTGPRFNMDSTLSIPTVCGVPTLKSNLIKKAAIAFDSCNGKFYQYNPKTFVWSEISGGGTTVDTSNKFVNNVVKLNDSTLKFFKGASNSDLVLSNGRFKNNIVLKGTSSAIRLGKYTATTSGTSIPVAGLDLDAAFKIICQETIQPTYTRPTVSISNPTGNTEGNYEYGTPLSINIAYSYTLNDSKSLLSGYIYRSTPNASNLSIGTPPASVTDVVDSLKTIRQYYNYGNFDSANPKKNSDSVYYYAGNFARPYYAQSATITYTPVYRRFWGYCAGNIPTNAEILAAAGGSSPGSELNNSGIKSNFSVTIPSGPYKKVFYAFSNDASALTSIKNPNNNEIIGTFDKYTNVSYTNPYNVSYKLQIYVTQNQFQGSTFTFASAN